MHFSQGDKRRAEQNSGPNEMVACTSCEGNSSPCTHTASSTNGCATEVILYLFNGLFSSVSEMCSRGYEHEKIYQWLLFSRVECDFYFVSLLWLVTSFHFTSLSCIFIINAERLMFLFHSFKRVQLRTT